MSAKRRAPLSPGVLGCLVIGTLPFALGALWALFGVAEAVLAGDQNRAIALGFLAFFLLLFVVIPVLIALAVGASRIASQDRAVRKRNHPEAPWLWREDWARGAADFEQGTAAIVAMGLFAGVWNGMVLIMVLAMTRNVSAEERVMVFGFMGLFVLAGLFLAFFAVRLFLQRLRYGRSRFALDALPATPGGQLSGVVHAPAGLASAPSFRVRLEWVEIFRGRKSSSEQIRWHDELTLSPASVDRGPEGVAIPVAFAVPAEGEPSSPRDDERQRTLWRLNVDAEVPGVDYEASFEVPVFRTTDVRQVVATVQAPRARPLSPDEIPQPTRSRIRVEQTPEGCALQFPRPSWLVGWTLVPMMFVPLAAWLRGQPITAEFEDWMVLLAGVGATLFFWGIVFMGLVMTPNRIEITGQAVVVRRGLGRLGWGRTIPLREVKDVVVKTIGSSGQTQNSVDILGRDGTEYWAAFGLTDLSEAKWLAGELERLVRAAQDGHLQA